MPEDTPSPFTIAPAGNSPRRHPCRGTLRPLGTATREGPVTRW